MNPNQYHNPNQPPQYRQQQQPPLQHQPYGMQSHQLPSQDPSYRSLPSQGPPPPAAHSRPYPLGERSLGYLPPTTQISNVETGGAQMGGARTHMGGREPVNDTRELPPVPGSHQFPPGAEPPSYSSEVVEEKRSYRLEVVQQPQRARMCGFGDKDRRPITPPPCIRLIILDTTDGKEVSVNQIDSGTFILTVDLWSQDGRREVNLVRHSNAEHNIPAFIRDQEGSEINSPYSHHSPIPGPASTGYAYQQSPTHAIYGNQQPNAYPAATYGGAYHQNTQTQNGYAPQSSAFGQPGSDRNGHIISQYENGNDPSTYRAVDVMYPVLGAPQSKSDGRFAMNPAAGQMESQSSAHASGMFTRNLIGSSLASSSSILNDPSGHIGIWFVLGDLSVRTEGTFRLRFSFVKIGLPDMDNLTPQSGSSGTQSSSPGLNRGKNPILASCYSAPFQVFSAKRFPGVVESTNLSKTFATQGIKIPIRKEGAANTNTKNKAEYDNDD